MRQLTIPIRENYTKGEPLVKRLSDVELWARLDKVPCFKCNEKYSEGHCCKVKENRELMFIMNEEEGEDEDVPTVEG